MSKKRSGFVVLFAVLIILLSGCPESPTLPGDITGTVKNSKTSEPIEAATIKVIQTNDSTLSKVDGTFTLKNIDEGNHDIQASKSGYLSITEDIVVSPAKTQTIYFDLDSIPFPEISPPFLAFDLDSTSLSFIISNKGDGILNFNLIPSQSWINVSPSAGTISESDTILVTINRTEISDNINYDETIKLKSSVGSFEIQDILIDVFINGVYDPRSDTHYPVVKIGSQIWMAENMNVGNQIYSGQFQSDNNIIEKYCINDILTECAVYGGLYQWFEMMQYQPSDSGIVSTTQGICPAGYHIPSGLEWDTLTYAIQWDGGKLKEEGTIHWNLPNLGATNETGFTALPSGWSPCGPNHQDYQKVAMFYSSTATTSGSNWIRIKALTYDQSLILDGTAWTCWGLAVRCVKNP